jgi:hypothetical protein
MSAYNRKLAFVLAASDPGTMIVSRLDYCMTSPTNGSESDIRLGGSQ